MRKILIAAVATSTLFATAAQAEPVGLVRGLVGTGVAVLQAPGLTLTTLLTDRALIVGKLPPLGLNFVNALVPILTNQPVKSTTQTVIVPLPGPEFLNMTLVNLPDRIGVKVGASGPITFTLTTGPQ